MPSLLHRIVDYPPILDLIRRMIEANFRAEKEVIRRELPGRQGLLLDLPCGTGIFAELFPDESYVGLDLGEHYVARAKRRYPAKTFLVGDALALPFPDTHFDSVLTIGFLHHLDPPEVAKALSEIHRVLKPGGKFLLIEDRPVLSFWNLPGKFLQKLDAGGRIRPMAFYEKLLREKLTIEKSYPLKAGMWEYGVFLGKK